MRLIDADALIETIWQSCNMEAQELNGVDSMRIFTASDMSRLFDEIVEYIDNAPTIEAEPVVRCIDCIFWYDCEYPFKSENGFCCCGEREEE